eukprot:sb/3477131/
MNTELNAWPPTRGASGCLRSEGRGRNFNTESESNVPGDLPRCKGGRKRPPKISRRVKTQYCQSCSDVRFNYTIHILSRYGIQVASLWVGCAFYIIQEYGVLTLFSYVVRR